MRKTKIICTLGPAIDDDIRLKQLMLAGLDCARVNFSHGTHEEQRARIERVRRVSGELGLNIPVLLDTKGPEIRLRDFEGGSAVLKKGQLFTLDTGRDIPGDETRIGTTYDRLARSVKPGTRILIDDGRLELKVSDIKGTRVICRVVNGGRVSNHKSINVPNVDISMPYLSDIDKSDILLGIGQGVEYIAASFVRNADDVKKLRRFVRDNGGGNIKIISKIENGRGVENLDAIIDLSDGIMVARGDLGVEIAYEKIPAIQKYIIEECNSKGKLVITATQMLESMTLNPRPTRAEVSDVANAIYDGTTAIMLSGESAAGDYPVEAVKTMANIALEAEAAIDYDSRFELDSDTLDRNTINAVCASAYNASKYLDARAIIVMTRSGRTARMMSYFRPKCPVIAVTLEETALRQLNLSWGVTPIASSDLKSVDEFVDYALAKAKESKLVRKGDKVIALLASDIHGENDIMRICQIA